jgi:tetratricopeptide (TPR) repeat protein
MRIKIVHAAACAVMGAALFPAAPPLTAPAAAQELVKRAPNIDQSKMDDSIRSYQDAVKYYQNGQLGLAEQELQKFLSKVGEHAGGNFLMGLVQAQQGNLEKARTSFRTTVKLDPSMVAPKGWLGAVEAALGNLPGAAAQKAELDKLNAACAGSCPKAAEIAQAIQRIDENVAAVNQSQPRN